MRISSRLEPKPDQTIHVTTSQKVSISGNIGTQNAQIVTESVLAYKQVNGRYDDQGRMEANLTIERVELQQTIAGNTKSSPGLDALVGRNLTAIFDRSGKLVDVNVPKDLDQIASQLKQMTGGAYSGVNLLPVAPMAVGDTETIPSAIPLRLPGGGTSPYQTRTTTTLRSVEKSGNDQIAHFEQRIESVAQSDQLTVTGSGAVDVNLDRGFITATSAEWNFEGNDPTSSKAPSAPTAVRGTIKITVTAHE
jgi:hypothetical protein